MNCYQHTWVDGQAVHLPTGKVVCIGQNYAEHIEEMKAKAPGDAVFFIKPRLSLVPLSPSFTIPIHAGACHHELELALLIGSPLTAADPQQAMAAVTGFSVALDLTLRELQTELKRKGHPWERAKSFDASCPIAPWTPFSGREIPKMQMSLEVNDKLAQQCTTDQMIRDCATLLSEASHWFSFEPGDVLLTGTPAGVGPLNVGDRLKIYLNDDCIESKVIQK